jgi:HEAT repeat protein
MKRCVPLSIALLAALALGRGGGRAEAAAVLERFLGGAMPLNQVVNRLEFLGEQRWATEALLAALHRSGDSDARRRTQVLEALAALAPPGNEDAERVLVATLADEDLTLRLSAARALGRLRSARAVPPLSALLEDHAMALRRDAARALGLIGIKTAAPALAAVVKREPELEPRLAMILALGQVGDARQAPLLESFSKDSSQTTRLAAAQALCALGAPSGLELARRLLASKDEGERLQGVLLFEGVKPKVAAPLLQGALAQPEHRVRATAARVLAQGGDAGKIDWLVLESRKAQGEDRLIYEDQLEKLHVSFEKRQAILQRAGAK